MASTTCNALPVTIPKPPMPLAIDELDSCDSEPRTPAYTANRKSVHTTPTNSNQSSGNAGVPSSGSIDYNKFRTRMCHYHLIQKPCPFGERCAFAHGEEQINTPLPPAALERVMASHHRSTNGTNNGTGYCSQTRPLFHGSSNFLMGAPLPAPARPLPLFPAPMTRPPYSPTAGTVVTRLNQSANGSTSDAKLLATTVCSASVTRVSSMTGEEKPLSFTSAGESMMSSASCSSSALMPPPPAYECRVVSSDDFYAVGLPLSGRFRYDPYSPNGYCVIASA